jgi:hypothetical protein
MSWLVCLLFLFDPSPLSAFRQQGSIDLAALSPSEALRLSGQWLRVRISIDSVDSSLEGPSVYECRTSDHVSRTACFCPEQEIDERKPFEVEGRFIVIHHARTFIDGVPFTGFVEYRVTEARRVRR